MISTRTFWWRESSPSQLCDDAFDALHDEAARHVEGGAVLLDACVERGHFNLEQRQ